MENPVKYCENCKRDIENNFDLHIIHCKKNIKLCIMCQEPVRSDEMKEHLESMHIIELCDFCKKPFERWRLEKHKNDCLRKPLMCKFCNLDVAADDFEEHAKMCWSRTEKCETCSQYVKLRDLEVHEKICKNHSMIGFAECIFCKENFSLFVIETHESTCGEKNTRCPECGELIKKYKNNHACKAIKNSSSGSVRSGKANGHDMKQDISTRSSFNDNHHSSNSFPIEPAKNQAVEISPPVQRDLSDPKFNRVFREENPGTLCNLCQKYVIPQETRIHPEICSMRLKQCPLCEYYVPYCHLKPALHQCPSFLSSPGDHKFVSSILNEPSRKEKYAPEYSSPSNLSREYPKIYTQDCPLCSKTFPADRFNDHVRACAEGKRHCNFCKKDYYGGFEEHWEECSKNKQKSNKGAKQKANKEEKNEGFITRGWNYLTSGQKKEKRGNRSISNLNPEKQLVVDGIPCEFCNEIYPFAEIAVHELGCLHEMSQAEKRMKESVSMKKPINEVPQASGYTPYDPSKYMITEPIENKDYEPRNKRLTEKSSKDVSSKISYSEPNQGSGKSHNYQSETYYNNFYEKHLVKDHEKDNSAVKSHREPKKAFEEEKKKNVIFVYSSEAKNKFPVQEKRLEQGARPKNLGEFPSKNYLSHKGLNCLSDSDEETDLHQNKVKDVNLENNRGFSSIGSEREQKKSSIESKNNYPCISNENGRNPKSSSQDVSSCVTNKKGSFNSDTSEDVYLSCDEGEEIPEGRPFNKDAKVLKNEERDNKKVKNCSTDERPSNQEDVLQKHDISRSDFDKYLKRNDKDANIERDDINSNAERRSLFSMEDRLKKHGISMNDIDKYLMRDKDTKILKNEEKDGRNYNTEMISLSSKEDRLKKQGIDMNDFDQYLKGDQNYNHHLKPIDSITSKSSIILSDKEEHSLLHKYVMDIDDLEREESKKNEKHSLLPKYVMDIDDLEREEDKKNEETFASESQIDMNPFEAMSNSQYSYEAVSSFPPYSLIDLDSTNHGAVDIKSDENLDAYLQFLGLDDPEPDANYRLFGSTHGTKVLEPDSSYGYLENVRLGANNTNDYVPKPTSVPQEPSVQTEELKGVSKNMPSYTSPFLLGNEGEERELGISIQRSFPVSLQEEKIRVISDKSRIVVDLQSQEEKDNELNSKMWGTWRSPRQIDSDE